MPSSSGVVDAVVIGVGHNGLVAAAMLADAGWGRGGAGGTIRARGCGTQRRTVPGLHQRSVQRDSLSADV